METLGLLISLLALGTASAVRCCFPKQYEASQGLLRTKFEGNKASVVAGNIHYALDEISRREAFMESLIVDGQEVQLTIIKDYNVTNKKYIIENGNCIKESLEPFREGCIDDSMPKLTDGFFAAPGSGTTFSVYNNSASDVTSFLLATQPDAGSCYPILDLSTKTSGSAPFMQASLLYNFTLGIQDPSVFDIPKICQT